jgi:phosphoacetylglucosamine mutase
LGLEFEIGKRYASLDGDADRLVYYYKDTQGQFRLLDGDKIATLAAGFLMELVKKANVLVQDKTGASIPLSVGLVQTAYANGSSTHFVKEQMVKRSVRLIRIESTRCLYSHGGKAFASCCRRV